MIRLDGLDNSRNWLAATVEQRSDNTREHILYPIIAMSATRSCSFRGLLKCSPLIFLFVLGKKMPLIRFQVIEMMQELKSLCLVSGSPT